MPPRAASSGVIASDEAHTPVSIKRIPKGLQLATVAIEDQRFYEHAGIDEQGIGRAALKNLEAGEAVEGGSTITQQLVRNLCIPNPEQNLERKIVEAKLAEEYFDRHSRREILGSYLNIASYGTIEGSTAVGVQAASRIYFDRPVWKLSLPQAALLAGLPQAPSEYNPILNPRAALARRNQVLRQMDKLGYVADDRAAAAMAAGLRLDVADDYFEHRQPYFFDYVENELISEYGVNTVRRGGLEVHTTIDPDLQEVGLEAMRSALPYSTDPSSALVSIDPRNGRIRAMVSSSNYAETQFNLAAQGHRQPGSTFKAFVLTTAIKQGIDPYSTYYTSKPLDLDLPNWGHWEVATADEGYQGTVNLQQATVSLRQHRLRPARPRRRAQERCRRRRSRWGSRRPLDGIPAEGIGGLRLGVSPLELTDAYATLAAGGIHHDPVAIERVVFPSGKVERPAARPSRAGPHRSRRLRGDATAARQHHRRHRHRRLHRLRRPGRQDRDHRRIHRRLVLRLPAEPGDRGLGRLPGVQRRLDVQRARDHRLRRHLPGRNLALALLRRRRALRGIRASRRQPISWAPYYGHFTQASPRDGAARADGGEREADRRPAAPRSAATTRAHTTPTPTRPAPARNRPRCHPRHPRRRQGPGDGDGASRPTSTGPTRVAEHRAGRCLRSDVGGLRRLPRHPRRRAAARAAPRLGGDRVAVAAFAVAPVLLSHDVYSYVDYARLGVLHGLDPYVQPPLAAPADPAFARRHLDRRDQRLRAAVHPRHLPARLAPGRRRGRCPQGRWRRSRSSAWPVLVSRLAAWRGVDPLRAAAFVALNPLVLVHVVGGPHNDALAMLLMTLGVAAILTARETSAGAALIAAVAIKASAAFIAPFALLAAAKQRSTGRYVDHRRRYRPVGRLFLGAGLAAGGMGWRRSSASAGTGWTPSGWPGRTRGGRAT